MWDNAETNSPRAVISFLGPSLRILPGATYLDNCEKVSEAAETCLAFTIGQERPFSRVVDFIALLRSEPEWSDPEIIEVQTSVIRALMSRLDSHCQLGAAEGKPVDVGLLEVGTPIALLSGTLVGATGVVIGFRSDEYLIELSDCPRGVVLLINAAALAAHLKPAP